MEHCSPETSINCCFCDKDLSPGDSIESTKSITKYKCPGCGRTYCSADCCSGHKEKFSCSGIRDQTPYVHIKNFNQKQFLDDFFFLEKISIEIERKQRILPRLRIKAQSDPNNKSSRRRNRNNYRRKNKPQAVQPSSSGSASGQQQ